MCQFSSNEGPQHVVAAWRPIHKETKGVSEKPQPKVQVTLTERDKERLDNYRRSLSDMPAVAAIVRQFVLDGLESKGF